MRLRNERTNAVLTKAFNPRKVAVVGASRDSTKIGHKVIEALVTGGFRGTIYPVALRAKSVLGLRAYTSVLEISDEVDLALISIPAPSVPAAIRECGRKGIKCAVVFSAGFGEIIRGAKLDEELLEAARNSGIRIIGPNTNGIMNLHAKLNATFTPDLCYKKGNVALVCQSGGYSSVLLRYGGGQGVGFSKVINLGNSSDLGFVDVLEFLRDDRDTKVIVMYMEGLRRQNEGRQFFEVARELTARKPIIALKVGISQAGRKAIGSHTGSLAGSDEVYGAAFRQAGVIRAANGAEMIDIAKALSLQQNLARGNKVAILTSLGGPGIVAADICESNGLLITELSESTKRRFSRILSITPRSTNPLDLAGSWQYLHLYKDLLAAALEDERTDAAILIAYITPYMEYKAFVDDILKVSKRHDKPIVACILSSDNAVATQCTRELEAYKIPCYEIPEKAARATVGLVGYSLYLLSSNHLANRLTAR